MTALCCELCDRLFELDASAASLVCPHCGRDHWRLQGATLTLGDVRTARGVTCALYTARDETRARALDAELLQRVLEAIAAHRVESPCDVADLAVRDPFAPFDRAHVGDWMRRNVARYVDARTGEVECGALAEGAAAAFDLDDEGGPLDVEHHWIWEIACHVAERQESTDR